MDLTQYIYNFKNHALDYKSLVEVKDLMTRDALKDIGIEKVGHQLKLLKAIKQLE